MAPILTASFLLNLCAPERTFGSQPETQVLETTCPPAVTCKAWAIADGRTGELLWHFNGDEPRKAASTTKMMCAYVVLQLAGKEPDVLDERVTFSELAAATSGSTARIESGESVTVRDCLFGLLLPSGNDAGNALAEHFNHRFAPPGPLERADLSSTNLATRRNFIAEMNRTAARLGLTNTVYRLPFGDGGTPDDRTTSARDLLTLAFAAMQNQDFRKYVATLHHDGEVLQTDGTPRAGRWTNTNQLLLEGQVYDGIKTGTTSQAGSCLVSSGHRGDDHLLVAVLGATSNTNRYEDTRSLFAWAWQQRSNASPASAADAARPAPAR